MDHINHILMENLFPHNVENQADAFESVTKTFHETNRQFLNHVVVPTKRQQPQWSSRFDGSCDNTTIPKTKTTSIEKLARVNNR
jgi:hypothetical protein